MNLRDSILDLVKIGATEGRNDFREWWEALTEPPAERWPQRALAAAAFGSGMAADRRAAASYLRGHAEEAMDSTTRTALFWAAEHIESGDHLAQETLPGKEG